jgi:hypothetical protein
MVCADVDMKKYTPTGNWGRQRLLQLTHIVTIHKSHKDDAQAWCQQQFGRRWDLINNRDGAWSMFWAGRDHYEEYRFSFAHEQDAAWFALRWL